VINVDSAFLKTLTSGAFLTIIGKDGNNKMFLIAWAVARDENKATWMWFLSLLATNLRQQI